MASCAACPPRTSRYSLSLACTRLRAMIRLALVALVVGACSERSAPTAPPAPTTMPTAQKPPSEDPVIANARQLVAQLVAGKYAEIVASFDETMTSALPAPALERTWKGLVGQVGAFETIEGARIERTST